MTEVLALSGGIGGAKLSLGLQSVLPAGALAVIVNTGDDMRHLGLDICPDIDTTLYTLAGVANEELGWGRAGESWHCLQELERIGADTWFRIGDKDLALHLERTRRLADGETLEAVTRQLAQRFGLATRVIPMSNEPVRTIVETQEGALPFQDYFVRRRCLPAVRKIRFDGAAEAHPAQAALELLESDSLGAIVICPSNPYLSVDPILAVAGLRSALRRARAPIVAVSPIIGGDAVKGPTAKIMRELGKAVSAAAVAQHYAGLIDGFVLDERDRALAEHCAVPVRIAPTLMRTLADKQRLAAEVIDFARSCAGHRARMAS